MLGDELLCVHVMVIHCTFRMSHCSTVVFVEAVKITIFSREKRKDRCQPKVYDRTLGKLRFLKLLRNDVTLFAQNLTLLAHPSAEVGGKYRDT